MTHLKALMLSRPFLDRIPDQPFIEGDPGTGRTHARATRAADGAYAFVYLPSGGSIRLRLELLSGTHLKAWWFDPRDGSSRDADETPRSGSKVFSTPTSGEGQDWILVVDDAARGFTAPGR